MKKRYAYRDGKIVELIKAPALRHPDVWTRLANEGTQGERILEGCKQWEQEHGSKGFNYSPDTFKKAWARDLPQSYGSMSDFRAYQETQNNQPD
jgi:hypothetical protein